MRAPTILCRMAHVAKPRCGTVPREPCFRRYKQRTLSRARPRSSYSGAFAFNQRLNFVINLELHWRTTGSTKRLVYSAVQTHRFQFVGTQAFGAGDYQISCIVSGHEEGGNVSFLSFRPDRRRCQKLRDFLEKLLGRVMSFLEESVRQNPTWIVACDVLSAHSYCSDVWKSLPYYRIFRSEMITSGKDLLSACKPSSPSATVRTS